MLPVLYDALQHLLDFGCLSTLVINLRLQLLNQLAIAIVEFNFFTQFIVSV
jgi:hypothetical protein